MTIAAFDTSLSPAGDMRLIFAADVAGPASAGRWCALVNTEMPSPRAIRFVQNVHHALTCSVDGSCRVLPEHRMPSPAFDPCVACRGRRTVRLLPGAAGCGQTVGAARCVTLPRDRIRSLKVQA